MRNGSIDNLLQNNRNFLILATALILAGASLGAIGYFALPAENAQELEFVSGYLVSGRLSMTFVQVMGASLISSTIFMMIPFFLGFCALSQPLILLLPVFRGAGLGIGIASVYGELGAKGIGVAAASVLLPAFFTVYALATAVRESLRMSVTLASAVFTEKNFLGLRDHARLYCVKFLVLEAVAAVGAAVDGLCAVAAARIS